MLKSQIEGTPVTVGVGSGLAGPGYSFLLSTDTAGLVWEAILNAGAVPMGAAAWEQLRVWQGKVFFYSLIIFSFPYIVKNHYHKSKCQHDILDLPVY